jgi:GntR family transcriptional regulator, transcriptional repressor for pyruvate dehydrogenase complex
LSEVLRPVRTPRVYSEVVTQILRLVESGQIAVGDRLPPERTLAEQLRISRSSVREAMTALEVLGVVEIRAGHGIFVGRAQNGHLLEAVSTLTEEQGPLEILEARLMFEPGVAELAAQRRTESDLHSMRVELDLMKEQLERGLDAWKPDWGFHQAVGRAAQNSLVESVLEVITQRMQHPLWTLMRTHNFERRDRAYQYLQQHGEIMAAVEAGDGKQAHRAMRRHIVSIQRDLDAETSTGASSNRQRGNSRK